MHGTHSSPRSLVLARTSLIASVVIAGAIQIALAVRSPVVARDGIAFIRTAQALVRDPLRTIRETDQHPGYPVMIVLGRTVAAAFTEDDRVHAWEAGALLMSGLCGLLSVVVIWLLARRLFDERTAGVAALLFAILPLFRQNASDALSDTPHLLFFLLATYLVVEGFHRRQAGWFALAGLTSGAAYLIRPEGLLVALVGGAALVLAVFSGRMRRGTVVAGLLGLILAAGAAAGPYVLVKGSLTSKKDFTKLARSHKWIPKSRSGAGHFEPSSHATPVKGSRPSPSPVRVLSSGLAEVFQEYAHGLRYVLLLPVMAGFLVHRRLGGDRTSGRFVAALAAGHAVLLLTLYANSKYVSHRHVIPLAALSMSWAAAGVVFLSDRMSLLLGRRSNASARPRYGWVLCVITGILVLGLLPRSLRPQHRKRLPLLRAAQWLRAHRLPDDTVLTNSVYVPFYADTPGRVIRKGERISTIQPTTGPSHRFVVLETDSRSFHTSWLTTLNRCYRPIAAPGISGGENGILLLRGHTVSEITCESPP